jgi:uncharacterized membrane protein YphA (DoxX/SURF4 family)
MNNMEDSIARPGSGPVHLDLPAWKTIVSIVCSVLLAALFLVSGTWKITDPLNAATRMTQALVPSVLSLPAAIGFGIAEVFSGLLLLVPRFRRWGAWLCGLMLIAFLVYFAVFYNALRGADCSCFPWLKRAVGPGFFIGDGIMLAMAYVVMRWSRPSESLRSAMVVLGAVAVFAGASYGVLIMRQTGLKAPATITVDGQPYSLQQGKVYLYFFDPECSHCDRAARDLAKHVWKDVTIIAIPTRMPQFNAEFLRDTGLKAKTSSDLALLKQTFPFGDPPYGVALENGRQKAATSIFDQQEPVSTLKKIDFIE